MGRSPAAKDADSAAHWRRGDSVVNSPAASPGAGSGGGGGGGDASEGYDSDFAEGDEGTSPAASAISPTADGVS